MEKKGKLPVGPKADSVHLVVGSPREGMTFFLHNRIELFLLDRDTGLTKKGDNDAHQN